MDHENDVSLLPNGGLKSRSLGVCYYAKRVSLAGHSLGPDSKRLLRSKVRYHSRFWQTIHHLVELEGWQMSGDYLYLPNMRKNDKPMQGEEKSTARNGDLRMRIRVARLKGADGTFFGGIESSGSGDNELYLSEHRTSDKVKWIYFAFGNISKEKVLDYFTDSFDSSLLIWRIVSFIISVIGAVLAASIVRYCCSWIPFCGGIVGGAIDIVAVAMGALYWLLLFCIAYFIARTTLIMYLFGAIAFFFLYATYQSLFTDIKMD